MPPAIAPAPSVPSLRTPAINRRRFTRIPARQLRGCLIARGVASDNVWVVDISLGGAFLRTSEPLPIDERLALELPQPGQRTLRLIGHVVSRRVLLNAPKPPGMGICFDSVSPMALIELRELIRGFAPSTALESPGRDEEDTQVAPVPPSISTPPPIPSAPILAAPRATTSSVRLPVLTVAQPAPLAPPRPSIPRPLSDEAHEVRQLKNHVKGLLVELGDVQSQLASKTRENEALREAVAQLQASNAALRRG